MFTVPNSSFAWEWVSALSENTDAYKQFLYKFLGIKNEKLHFCTEFHSFHLLTESTLCLLGSNPKPIEPILNKL